MDDLFEVYSDKKNQDDLKPLLMSNEFQSKLPLEDLIFSETCTELGVIQLLLK